MRRVFRKIIFRLIQPQNLQIQDLSCFVMNLLCFYILLRLPCSRLSVVDGRKRAREKTRVVFYLARFRSSTTTESLEQAMLRYNFNFYLFSFLFSQITSLSLPSHLPFLQPRKKNNWHEKRGAGFVSKVFLDRHTPPHLASTFYCNSRGMCFLT